MVNLVGKLEVRVLEGWMVNLVSWWIWLNKSLSPSDSSYMSITLTCTVTFTFIPPALLKRSQIIPILTLILILIPFNPPSESPDQEIAPATAPFPVHEQ